MCRCAPQALDTAAGALAAASYELGNAGSPTSPAAARSPFEAALHSCQRTFSGFGASNAVADLEVVTSQRSLASSKVWPCLKSRTFCRAMLAYTLQLQKQTYQQMGRGRIQHGV